MEEIQIIIRQIIILALLGITGFVVGKKRILPDDSQKYISTLILKITMPLLIFTTMGNYSFTRKNLTNGLYIFIFGVIFILMAGLISLGPCKVMGIKDKTKNIFICQSMFGNVMFMAYPLLGAMYPNLGIVYAIFFNIASDAILWTLGVYLFNKHNSKSWKDNLSHLLNYNTLAFLCGIIMIVLKSLLKIDKFSAYNAAWSVFYDTFNGLGHTTIYLSMIFIGLVLSNIRLTGIKNKFPRYVILSSFKLYIVPIMAIIFFKLTNNFFDVYVKRIVALQLAMPAGTIVSVLALQYDSDYNAATEGVFITTILSMLTLPFIVYLLI